MLTPEILTQRKPSPILFECISGSRAYGTSNSERDTDIRGVFAQPSAEFLALSRVSADRAIHVELVHC